MRPAHVVVALGALWLAPPALAHFKLVAPASNFEQDTLGGPQKSAPCGQADPNDPARPTNEVTQLQTGSMVTITVNETVFHPGHYRVSLAQDMGGLPADPMVTAGSTACGSTPINANPTLPLLADGLLQHTSAFAGAQSMQVQLPAGMTCTNCILQITEFMSNHSAPCYYHHCAAVTISDTPPGGDTTTGTEENGCCSTGGGGATSGLLALTLAALVLRKRRQGVN